MPTSIVFRIAKVTPQTALRGARTLWASLISFRSSSAVVAYDMHRCFVSFWGTIWRPSMMGLAMRLRLTTESPCVWLVEARGVVDGEAFAEIEPLVFEDDLNNFLSKSGISIHSRSSSWRSSAISSLTSWPPALRGSRSYLDSFEWAI
jgi:hypothetical protein